MKKDIVWPLAVVGLLLANVGVVGITIAAAAMSARTSARVLDEAAHWNDSAAQQQSNRVLGWHVSAEMWPGPLDNATSLRIAVRDGADRPIRAARVHVLTNASAPEATLLQSQGDGTFVGSVPSLSGRAKVFPLRVTVDAIGMRFTAITTPAERAAAPRGVARGGS